MNVASISIMNANLGRDPESRYTPNGVKVVNFTCAVNIRQADQETTAWYRISAFGRLAETLEGLVSNGHLHKGSSVCVIGRFNPRDYTANDGAQRTSLDVAASDVILVGGAGQEREQISNGSEVPDTVPF